MSELKSSPEIHENSTPSRVPGVMTFVFFLISILPTYWVINSMRQDIQQFEKVCLQTKYAQPELIPAQCKPQTFSLFWMYGL